MSEWMGGWLNNSLSHPCQAPQHVPSSLHMSSFILAAVSCCGGSHSPLLVICSYACTPFCPGCGSQLSPEPRAVSEVLPQAQPGKLPVSFHRAFLALPWVVGLAGLDIDGRERAGLRPMQWTYGRHIENLRTVFEVVYSQSCPEWNGLFRSSEFSIPRGI